ncbi:glycosyltransferase family 61 protein [uncultured Arthrobacter sp.]|uniref:glycosyltransferase family 61 protein n=1 Tax=uncultured Arthrobacter sp. TaxID=114050 RepID=UPI0032164AC2
MDQVEKIVSTGWRDGSSIACVSGMPVEDMGAGNFRLKPGRSIDDERRSAVIGLQKSLSAVTPAATAFMIHDGLVLGNGFVVSTADGLVRESRYLVKNLERRVELSLRDETVVLDDSIAWIIAGNASSKSNYWHWFAQILPAILHSRDLGKSLGRTRFGVITESLKEWQIESLLVLGINRDSIVEINQFQHARAATLFYSSFLSGVSVFADNIYRREIRRIFIDWAGQNNAAPGKIVVSRRDTNKRPLMNEDLLHAELALSGFKVMTGGSLTLREQIQAFQGASVVIAPHGAGSTNVLFGRKGALYIELGQLSYPNAGPLSLCKSSEMLAWIDLFEDDGKGQSTGGWKASIELVRDTVAIAMHDLVSEL